MSAIGSNNSSAPVVATQDAVASQQTLTQNFDTFLNLLVTQLQNQDPLEPMDTNEFTQQLVQYSEVEQAISTNDKLTELVDFNKTSQQLGALGYLGHRVEVDGSTLAVEGENVTPASYQVEQGDYKNVEVLIQNSAGQTIRALPGNTTPGTHQVQWDGLDDNGISPGDGTYNMVIRTTDLTDTIGQLPTKIQGTVRGIFTNDNNETILDVDGTDVNANNVQRIFNS